MFDNAPANDRIMGTGSVLARGKQDSISRFCVVATMENSGKGNSCTSREKQIDRDVCIFDVQSANRHQCSYECKSYQHRVKSVARKGVFRVAGRLTSELFLLKMFPARPI